MREEPTKLCECGCGEKTARNRRGRPNRFIRGHQQRARRGAPLADRFRAKVAMTDHPAGCWLWIGATRGRPGARYGTFWAGQYTRTGRPTTTPAHRVAYELLIGPIPVGLELDHLCRNTLCVNPAHLEPVTSRENHLRAIRLRDAGGRWRESTA